MVAIHTLKLRLSFLAHDLCTFQSNPRAEACLLASVAPHNIGPPYLTEHEALATPLHNFRSTNNLKCNPPQGCLRNTGYISRQATRGGFAQVACE